MTLRRPQKLHQVQTPDEGLVLVPFKFQVNNTSDADHLSGDTLVSAAFAEAGEYLCTLRDSYAVCFGGFASISNTADDVDLYAKVDSSSVVSAGTFTVRCMTAATQTTPTNDTFVSGFLVCKKTTRAARGG
jgi:hypothetical protein